MDHVLPADKLVGSGMILLPSRERVNTQNGDRPPGLEGGLRRRRGGYSSKSSEVRFAPMLLETGLTP